MQKRFVAVLAVAAAAGVLFPFGLPKTAAAAGPTYASISIKPLPLEQPGTLSPTGTNTVTACVQPLDSSGHVVPGGEVLLSIDSGLFTVPSGTPGGSASAEGMGLTVTPTSFTVDASCSYQNNESSGTLMDAIPVTYTGPSPALSHGRDVIGAQMTAGSFSATTGLCSGPGVCSTATYAFSPVSDFVFSAVPIAATGSLGAGTATTVTVTAVDNSTPPQPVPGAFFQLSLSSTAGTGGTATANNSFSGNVHQHVNNMPSRVGADSFGQVVITYTTPTTLPSTGVVDTITAQDHPVAVHEESTTYTYSGSAPPPNIGPYTAVTPFRVCDTRPVSGSIHANQCNTGSTGAGQGPITQSATRVITIDGFGGVPGTGNNVTAVVLNVTSIAPSKNTFISLFPDGSTRSTSNLNPSAGTVIANLVEVGVSAAGKVDVFNDLGTVNVALDIEGYVSSSSPGLFNPVHPTRICDTRASGNGVPLTQCNGSGTRPVLPGSPLTFSVSASGSPVPGTGVSAVIFNLTAVSPTKSTFVTAYQSNVAPPNASNINVVALATMPNRVIVPVSPSGTVSILNSVGSVNVIVDIDGWFTDGTSHGSSDARFTALAPGRVCNTLDGNNSDAGCTKGFVASGHALNIDVAGIDGVPVETSGEPVAVVCNVTAFSASSATFITVYAGPAGAAVPGVSDLNVTAGTTTTNLVVATIGSDGTINLFNDLGNVNLIVDVLGYYS
jgi:hypothetical protein